MSYASSVFIKKANTVKIIHLKYLFFTKTQFSFCETHTKSTNYRKIYLIYTKFYLNLLLLVKHK